MTFEILDTRLFFTGRVFKLRQDLLRFSDGRQVKMDIIEHPGAVTILPLDDEGNIWLIRQYRHAAGCELLEIPAGGLEPGELPVYTAEREIREEIGMRAGELISLGAIFLAPGYSTEYLHIYLAQKLEPDPLPPDDDERITIERIAIPDVYRMVENGEIKDAKTIAALLLARSRLLDSG